MQPELHLRAEVTQATLDRFVGKPLIFGSADCAQMIARHLRAMGHRVLLSKGGRYQSARGALRAIRRAGYDNLTEALDAMGLERIPPAAAITGDIISLPTDAELECLMIVLGNGRALGWVDGVPGAAVVQPVMYENGWRVPCLKR
jgi:hypothetical protein